MNKKRTKKVTGFKHNINKTTSDIKTPDDGTYSLPKKTG